MSKYRWYWPQSGNAYEAALMRVSGDCGWEAVLADFIRARMDRRATPPGRRHPYELIPSGMRALVPAGVLGHA